MTERVEPESAQFEFRSALDVPCVETTESTRDELLSAVERQAELLTAEMSCRRAGTCSLDTPQLTGCRPHNDRKRRRRAAPPGVDLLVTMTYRLRHHDVIDSYHFTGMSQCSGDFSIIHSFIHSFIPFHSIHLSIVLGLPLVFFPCICPFNVILSNLLNSND